MVSAEGGSLRFWRPGLLSTSPAFSMSSASHSAVSSAWLAPKTGAGPTFQWAGKVDPFVDPDRIEQSDRVQAASFALFYVCNSMHEINKHGYGSLSPVVLNCSGNCPEFQCDGGTECRMEGLGDICHQLPRYCIHNDQRCNEISNCGFFDDSDERKCKYFCQIVESFGS